MKVAIVILLLLPSICFGATYKAEVMVGWVGTGSEQDSFRPDFGAYTVGLYRDVTGQPGGKDQIKEPNQFIAYIECDNSTLDKMKQEGYVILWQQKVGDTKPVPKETKVSLDSLKTALEAKGVPVASLSATALADTSKADVTAVDISTQLKAEMAKFPAKEVAK